MEKANRLSDYELAELKLGGGGQANVYSHFDARSEMTYAVKIMKTDETNDKGREWHIREIVETMNKINHPRLLRGVTYHKFANDGFALVMPYYELGSLSTQRASRTFSMSQKKEAIRQLLQGLCHLHGRQAQHRDIKPQNVLVETLDPLSLLMADFGQVSLSNPRSFCGTDGYRAPEIFYNLQQRDYTNAVDIYSLGMLLLWFLGLDPINLPAYVFSKDKHDKEVGSKIDAAIDRTRADDERNAFRAARRMTQWEPDSRGSAEEWLRLPWLASPTSANESPQLLTLAPPTRRSSRISGQAKASRGRIQKSKAKITLNTNPRRIPQPIVAKAPSSDVSMKDISGPRRDVTEFPNSGLHRAQARAMELSSHLYDI